MARLSLCLLSAAALCLGCSQASEPPSEDPGQQSAASSSNSGQSSGTNDAPGPAAAGNVAQNKKSPETVGPADPFQKDTASGGQQQPPPTADSGQPTPGKSAPNSPQKSAGKKRPKLSDALGETKGKQKEPIPQRTSLAGRWILYLSQPGAEFPVALLEVTQADGDSYQGKLLETDQRLGQGELTSSELTKTTAEIVLDLQQIKFDFRGRLKNGKVLGNVLIGEGNCVPARWMASKQQSLKNVEVKRSAGTQELIQLIQSQDPAAGLKSFAKKHAGDPLVLTAYQQVLAQAKNKKFKAAALKQIAADYIKAAGPWGPRMDVMARVNVGRILAGTNYLPGLALEYLQEAESQLKQVDAAGFQSMIDSARNRAEIAQAQKQINSDDKKKRQQALARLQEVREDEPFNHLALHALAHHAENQGNLDKAIELNAQLAAVPLLEQLLQREWSSGGGEHELPSKTLERLWKKKHGHTDGLQAYLDKTYKKAVQTVPGKKVPPRAEGEGNRIVLCELFTGAQCPPCVAADLATSGLTSTYAHSELVVLQYHQHVPGPDPLTNKDAEARFAYYNGQGTPTLCLNGKKVPNAGGFMISDSKGLYSRLREQIDPALTDSTDIRIELAAKADGDKLNVAAQVTGVKESGENLRLRLALAEDEVSFVARNGVRLHEMVVRTMPGGPKGIALQGGQGTFEKTIDLESLKQKLFDYLVGFEQGKDVEFSSKPLDLRPLHLVAFVQNDATKEILQTAVIPVEGNLEYPAVSELDKPEPPPKSESKGKSGLGSGLTIPSKDLEGADSSKKKN